MNYRYLGRVQTAHALRELKDTPLWDAFTFRQDLQGSAHKDTKCIPLRGPLSFLDALLPTVPRTRTEFADQLPATMSLVNTVLEGLNVAEVGNVMAVSLQPGGLVRAHTDHGPYADRFERLHIVVQAVHRRDVLRVGSTYYYPDIGDIFLFNHRVEHSAMNWSDEPRIHIIVDFTLKE